MASGQANGNGNGQAKSALAGKGVVTVEVLNQLIRENPANMTQAVRSWLGRAKTKTKPGNELKLWKPPPPRCNAPP